jgi:hypothetical protein
MGAGDLAAWALGLALLWALAVAGVKAWQEEAWRARVEADRLDCAIMLRQASGRSLCRRAIVRPDVLPQL